jgi:DNA-binding LytR/AlgR family response regulator
MTTLIIEDEKVAAERLQLLIQQCASGVKVQAMIDSVEESIAWLTANKPPDFILFRKVKINTPVIFTTAYHEYAIEAFKVLSIDYLLKPVTAEALTAAIAKLTILRPPVLLHDSNYTSLLHLLEQQPIRKYKSRFIGKVGQKLFFIDAGEVAYFLAGNKIVHLYANDGNHYIIEFTMEELEQMLDPQQFFRINRSIIVKARAIEQVKPYINSRLKIIFKSGLQSADAIVSRDRVNEFKMWANS